MRPTGLRALSAVGACLFLLGLTSGARADGSARQQMARLVWTRADGAEACISEHELRERVRVRLARDPFSDDATTLIEGSVRRDGNKLRATLRIRGGGSEETQGLRELESDELDCAALGNAVALAVALTIDPEAALAPPSAPENPTPAEPAPKVSPPKAIPPRRPTRRVSPIAVPVPAKPAPERRGDLSLRGVLSAGLLPHRAAGVALAGHVQVSRRFAGYGAMTYFPEVRTDSGSAAFGLTAGGLGACYALITEGLDAFEVCAGAELGALHSVAYDATPRNPGDRPWVAGSGALRASTVVKNPLLLELGLGLSVPMIRHDFVIKGEPGTVFSSSAVAALAFAGIGVVF